MKHAEGPGIEIAAESKWSEGVCPQDVTIRGNRIVHCGLNKRVAGILVLSDSPDARGQSMRNIVIEDNIIDAGNADQAVYIRNVDGLRFRRNQIVCTKTAITIRDCTNVDADIKETENLCV